MHLSGEISSLAFSDEGDKILNKKYLEIRSRLQFKKNIILQIK